MSDVDFVHLHVHSEFSTLDGMGKIDELFRTASEYGQHALAITDHGSMSGLYDAQKAGEKYGIKPILGCEFYYERENDGENGHLIVLAKSDKGLENMMKLTEIANVNNFYKKPRINWQYLQQYSKDLVVTSACLGSTLDQFVIKGQITFAKEWIRKFQAIFKEDFYLEIQPNSISEQLIVNKTLIRLADELNCKFIATNDAHYVQKNDAFAHEVLLALQFNRKMADEKRWKFDTQDFWLKSTEEMLETFIGIDPSDAKQALQNTIEVADKCNASFKKGNYLPSFYSTPEEVTERELLVEQTMTGARREGLIRDSKFMAEVQNEINVIDRNGYSGYFLVVADYVNTARNNGIIIGDGRGSGAGSKVAWLTGITKIPPHKYDLLFERFLADGREPDFDVDFSDIDAVFLDLQHKYGPENVARITAFGRMTPKAVCRKVMSCFGHENALINAISKLIPDSSKEMEEVYTSSPELAEYKRRYKVEFDVIDKLQNIISHESQHAGGVVICKNLSSHLPVKTRAEDRSKRIVGFDKYMLAELGHYKFDVLALETLPVIKCTLNSIKEATGKDIDLHKIDMECQEVYDMLCEGDVSGVFQLSNQASKVIEQQPRNFKDLIAINALIRPGTGDWTEYIARRKGKEWSIHEERLPYLQETEGLITYQEQFLLDAKTFAGWDIAFADKHIRKNKNITEDTRLAEQFVLDSINKGHTKSDAILVWTEIENAVKGGYSFNKSHSTSYAIISYQTAWLKCFYPEHFYASLMSSEPTGGIGQNAIASYIAECKQSKINILPPDINLSNENFVVTPQGISYRITTIKDVGNTAIEGIKAIRPIKDFEDFMERREKKTVRQNVLINLIKAGCFDFDNPNRADLLWQLDMMGRTKTQIKKGYECPRYDWNDKVKTEWEKDVLGMYLSSHPLEKYGFKPLSSFEDNAIALQGGEIYEIKEIQDKNKNDMAFVFINTLYGNIKVLIFASMWKRRIVQEQCKLNNVIMVKGKRSGDAVICNEIEVLEDKYAS